MKNISQWLVNIENEARLFYEKAAEVFRDDKDLELLLLQLAQDEKTHHAIVSKAFDLTKDGDRLPAALTIDDDTKHKIEELLASAKEKLLSGNMTKAELIEAVVQIEFTETNEIFLYVVSMLKQTIKNIYDSTSSIDSHKSRISDFVRSRKEFADIIPAIERIPSLNKARILTIEDDETMIEAFDIFLSDISEVENATSTAEALKKIGEMKYSAIIVDIKKQFVHGMEFYKAVTAKKPELAGKFLFLIDNECTYINFFDRMNLKYLEKPVSLKDVKRSVGDIV